MPIKCLGTPFSAGVFSRNAFAEASFFRKASRNLSV
jgi:hypothetical protein